MKLKGKIALITAGVPALATPRQSNSSKRGSYVYKGTKSGMIRKTP